MSATKSAPGAPDWQQYWDKWFEGQRAFFDGQLKGTDGAQGQWGEFFKAWQGNLSPTLPGANNYQQYFQQAGQQYLDMLQHFSQSTGQNKTVADTTNDWLKTMQGNFLNMLQANTQPMDIADSFKNTSEAMMKAGQAWAGAFQPNNTGGAFGNPFGGMTQGLGSSPFGNFNGGFGHQNFGQGFGQGFGQNFAQGFGNWNPQAQAAPFQNFDIFGFAASIPGIGYTREKQEEYNELYKRFATFQTETRKYNAAMAQVGIEALHKFQEYVQNPPEGDAPLKSLKEVYARWVDVCEEVYAKYAMSEEYTALYGEVVNALMSFKAQVNHMTDEMMGQLNLPTRKEVDSLHERLHDIRRENLSLRKAVDELRGVKRPAGNTPAQKAAAKAKTDKKGGKK